MATWTARADLPLGDHTVRDARAFTLAAAQAWQPEVSTEILLLAVEELTAALVARVRGEDAPAEHSLVLELVAAEQGLRVSLADSSAVRSLAADLPHAAPGLVGLLLAAARDWGDEPYRGGYRLWFEVGPPEEPPTGPALHDLADPAADPDLEAELALRRLRRDPAPVDRPTAAELHELLGAPR